MYYVFSLSSKDFVLEVCKNKLDFRVGVKFFWMTENKIFWPLTESVFFVKIEAGDRTFNALVCTDAFGKAWILHFLTKGFRPRKSSERISTRRVLSFRVLNDRFESESGEV